MKSISGIVSYAKDVAKTAEFYETVGFIISEKTDKKVSIRLNWFWVDFHLQATEDNPEFQNEANIEPKGGGTYLYVSVEDVDAFYKGVLEKNLQPSSEPRNWPWGNREFVLRDPDGYKLVFFQKLKK